MLPSAHIKIFIYFSVYVRVVLKWKHPKNEQNRSFTLEPLHLNFEEYFDFKNFFKASSKSCMDLIF